jgi:cytochrome o ubiquinol oxidase subunit 2
MPPQHPVRSTLRRLTPWLALPALALLAGCNAVVLAPSGDVAAQQRDLLVISTVLMLFIIIPVIALVVIFAWKYRHSNTEAKYEPDWDHSTYLEVAIWGAPLLIIICLGAVTWAGTHLLDPYRPLDRIAAGRPAEKTVKPLQVNVVALDWKWLFIYPEYGIATVNELAAPVDRPIQFTITSSSVMNSFYIPALAGQIYAMPGMQTTLYGVINQPGEYKGFSANYSGAGFSGMRFNFHGLPQAGFDQWVAQVKSSGLVLDRAGYMRLEAPSENVPAMRFAQVDSGLFSAIVNLCVEPGKMCMHEMEAIDAKGGLDMESAHNMLALTYDKTERRGAVFGPSPTYVATLCTPADPDPREKAQTRLASLGSPADLARSAPMLGAGLTAPAAFSPAAPSAPRAAS